MDTTTSVDNTTSDEIRREIEVTREGLVDKLGALADRLQDVKSVARDKVDDFKANFSIRHQVRNHPFGFLLAGLGVGILVGRALSPSPGPPKVDPIKATVNTDQSLVSSLFDKAVRLAALTASARAVWREASQLMNTVPRRHRVAGAEVSPPTSAVDGGVS